jgi:hypothetical protein
MKLVTKDTSDIDAMVAAYKAKGGRVTKGKTRQLAHGLSISNNTWGQTLTRQEKVAKSGPLAPLTKAKKLHPAPRPRPRPL